MFREVPQDWLDSARKRLQEVTVDWLESDNAHHHGTKVATSREVPTEGSGLAAELPEVNQPGDRRQIKDYWKHLCRVKVSQPR